MFILYIYYRTKTVLVIRALALIHFQVSLISILWGDYLVISGKWGSYVNLNKAHKHFVFSHNTTKCTTNFMKIDKHVRLSVMRRHTVSWCYHFFHINLTRQPIESVRWTLQPSFSFVFFYRNASRWDYKQSNSFECVSANFDPPTNTFLFRFEKLQQWQ